MEKLKSTTVQNQSCYHCERLRCGFYYVVYIKLRMFVEIMRTFFESERTCVVMLWYNAVTNIIKKNKTSMLVSSEDVTSGGS